MLTTPQSNCDLILFFFPFCAEIDTINTARRKEKDAKKRANAAVIGDLHPLHDALPELAEILKIGPQYTSQSTR